jgi:hypothetical protein
MALPRQLGIDDAGGMEVGTLFAWHLPEAIRSVTRWRVAVALSARLGPP